jgi:hypothetical protein
MTTSFLNTLEFDNKGNYKDFNTKMLFKVFFG